MTVIFPRRFLSCCKFVIIEYMNRIMNHLRSERVRCAVLLGTLVFMLPLAAQVPAAGTVSYPESYYVFRDNMYNSHGKSATEFETEYKSVVDEINATKGGDEKQVLLARCDYVLGRAYRYLGMNDNATEHFDRAIENCKAILKKTEMVEAYVVYADCISQNCSIKPKAYAMAHGPKIKSMAKKALALDASYGAAMYLFNSQNIFTPPPFCDYEEGMKNLDRLLDTDEFRMDKSDWYNAITARAYGYLQLGMNAESKFWYNKALEIYPGNVATLDILKELE